MTVASMGLRRRRAPARGEHGLADFLRLGKAAGGRVVEDPFAVEAHLEYPAGRGDQHDLVGEVRTGIDDLARDPERAALEPARHAELNLEPVTPLLCHLPRQRLRRSIALYAFGAGVLGFLELPGLFVRGHSVDDVVDLAVH